MVRLWPPAACLLMSFYVASVAQDIAIDKSTIPEAKKSPLHRRAASSHAYAEFVLNPLDSQVWAGSLNSLGTKTVSGTAEAMSSSCQGTCNANAACIAYILKMNNARLGVCASFGQGSAFTQLGPGYNRIGWKYDAASGPACKSGTDSIAGPSGQCVCGSYVTQEQDTPFGCLPRLAPAPGPSQANALRKRLAKSRFIPLKTPSKPVSALRQKRLRKKRSL